MKERVMAAALAMGVGLGACGASETTHDNVYVNGWDVVQEADIMEYGWVYYGNESHLPGGELRDVDSYTVQTGSICAAYDKNFTCTVNVPTYDTRYDFERKEPVVAVECDQNPVFTEYAAPGVSYDANCWDSVGRDQWLEKDAVRYVLRIVLRNEDGAYTCGVVVDKEIYEQTVEEPSGLRAKESGNCNIRSLEYAE